VRVEVATVDALKACWPTQEEAASILEVDPSRVLRWIKELTEEVRSQMVVWNEREKLIAPSLVLQIGEQRSRDVYRAADALLRRADEVDDDAVRNQLRDEINGFLGEFEDRRNLDRTLTLRQLMDDLRTMLPPRAYAQLEERVSAGHGATH
jgi:hypothetical protein